MDMKLADPKGLIRESYNIEGITLGECRSIFLDWAINVPAGVDPKERIQFVLEYYGKGNPDHPMTQTLTEGLAPRPTAKRRGGRAARVSD